MRILHYTAYMENPTNIDQNPDVSLQEWIERAKRTHQLIEAVDLEKIVAHDRSELDKLRQVSSALDKMAAGKGIDHVAGIDEVINELDPRAQRRSQLVQLITQAGWADRIGRILSRENGLSTVNPLELIPHQEGLPAFDLCLAPKNAASDGCFGIFIYPIRHIGCGHQSSGERTSLAYRPQPASRWHQPRMPVNRNL